MTDLHRMRLASLVGLGSKVGGSGPALGEKAGEYWLDERTEDDLRTTIRDVLD